MKSLLENLPEYYEKSPEVAVIQNAFGNILLQAWIDRDDYAKQLNVNSATWGLDLWEEALDIKKREGAYAARRERIKSKLSGRSTTTASLISQICKSFTDGDVQIIEYPDQFRIEIKFLSTKGKPAHIDNVNAVIDEIIPAHLSWTFIFIYNTHSEIKQYLRTHAICANFTHEELRTEDIAS